MKQKNSEKGQALIVIAFAAVAIFAFAALAIDGGMVFSDRRHAQNAADTAALAAGLARARGQDWNSLETTAKDRATSNGYNDDKVNNIVEVSHTATASGVCPKTGWDITVDITSYVKTTFARVFGRTIMTNRVSASVRACDVKPPEPLYNGSAVMSTSTTSCNGTSSKNLYVGGSGILKVYGGSLASASQDGNCVDFSGGLTTMNQNGTSCGDLLTAATSISSSDLSHWNDNCGDGVPTTNATFDSPPSNLNISCGSTNAVKSGSTLSPGNYTGSFPPSGVTTLQAGTYCVDGNFKLNAHDTLTGTGVTIVMRSGYITWNGGSDARLTAPTGNYDSFGNYIKGLLIYLPPSNSSDMTLDGNSNATITGTILAQNSNCYYAGTGDLQRQRVQFICSTWQLNGNGTAEIEYDSSVFYSLKVDPTITILK